MHILDLIKIASHAGTGSSDSKLVLKSLTDMGHLEYNCFPTTWLDQTSGVDSRIQEGLIVPSGNIHLGNDKSLQFIFVMLVYRRTVWLGFFYLGQPSSAGFSEVGDLHLLQALSSQLGAWG